MPHGRFPNLTILDPNSNLYYYIGRAPNPKFKVFRQDVKLLVILQSRHHTKTGAHEISTQHGFNQEKQATQS